MTVETYTGELAERHEQDSAAPENLQELQACMNLEARVFARVARAAALRADTALLRQSAGNETGELVHQRVRVVRSGTDYMDRWMHATWYSSKGRDHNLLRSWCLAISEEGALVALEKHHSRVNGENPDHQWRERARGAAALQFVMNPDEVDEHTAAAIYESWVDDIEKAAWRYSHNNGQPVESSAAEIHEG